MGLKALMVDVDGVVVIHPGGRGWSDDMLADIGVDPYLLVAEFFDPYFDEIAMGRHDLFERLDPVLATIAPHITGREVVDSWFAKDAILDEALLADLPLARAQGLALHLATVQEHHRARYLWDTVGLRRHFDVMHYAADLGARKPQPEFFAGIARRTGFAPAEMRLIDDRSDNVEAAVAAGWSAFYWTPGATLSEALA